MQIDTADDAVVRELVGRAKSAAQVGEERIGSPPRETATAAWRQTDRCTQLFFKLSVGLLQAVFQIFLGFCQIAGGYARRLHVFGKSGCAFDLPLWGLL